jgi:hypothetical protein
MEKYDNILAKQGEWMSIYTTNKLKRKQTKSKNEKKPS